MKKLISVLFSIFFVSNLYAQIPYCRGTHLNGAKSDALQMVIMQFAMENNCVIGHNCILNFDRSKYSIAWSHDCITSERKGNDPKGSTFICEDGICRPLGLANPSATYNTYN